MADKTISELTRASQINEQDLFVLEQSSQAKSLTGQVLMAWIAAEYSALGYISSITKTGSSGTNPVVDTYTITFSGSADPVTFQITNGLKGDTGVGAYVHIKYSDNEPTRDADMKTTPSNWMGIYAGSSASAPAHYGDYSWFKTKGEKGDTGTGSSIRSQATEYQEGVSGTSVPQGTWTSTVPVVAQGKYLWTRVTLNFNDNTQLQYYSVSRYGIDGSGTVSTVNSVSPDSQGNVQLTIDDVAEFDAAPTASSSKLVNSGGIFTAISSAIGNAVAKITSGTTRKVYIHEGATQSDLDIDETATANSTNLITSGAVAKKIVTYTATLDTTWSGSAAPYSKEQTISGILASDTPIIDIVPSSTYATAQSQEEGWSNIYRAVCAANKITFYAHEKPTVSLPIKITCVR